MADLTIILSSRFAYFFNESHHSYCFLSEMVWNWFSKRLNHVNIWSAESQTHITKTKMAEMSDFRLSFLKVLLSHYCKSMWVVDCPKLIWWVIWLRKSIIRRKTNCMLKIKMAELTDSHIPDSVDIHKKTYLHHCSRSRCVLKCLKLVFAQKYIYKIKMADLTDSYVSYGFSKYLFSKLYLLAVIYKTIEEIAKQTITDLFLFFR